MEKGMEREESRDEGGRKDLCPLSPWGWGDGRE